MTQQQPEEDAIRHIFRLAEQDIRGVVRSEQNAQALADHYRVLADRQRETLTEREKEIASLTDDLGFALSAMRVYRELSASLDTAQAGAERLLSALRELEQRQCGAGRCAGEIARLTLESEGRRVALEQVSEGQRVEWHRAERAEAEREQLSAGIALACAYKTAVEKLDGVADAEAALFAWLEKQERTHAQP